MLVIYRVNDECGFKEYLFLCFLCGQRAIRYSLVKFVPIPHRDRRKAVVLKTINEPRPSNHIFAS